MTHELISHAILSALNIAGKTGLTEAAKKTAADSYESFKNLIHKKFGDQSEPAKALAKLESDPTADGQHLTEKLAAVNAAADPQLASAANLLLEILKALPQSGTHIEAAHGSVVTGDNAHVTINNFTGSVAAPSPDPQRYAVHLPQKPPLFIGRQPELAALRTRLQHQGSVVYIPGIAGCGKTTLALHYAHLYQRNFEAVHWLPCQSRSLAQIAAELTWQLGLKLDGDLDTILRELTAHCARKRCLLILDNVDDETPARLLPNGRASVLITTRRNDLDFLSFHRPLDLPLFSEPQCFELFCEVLGAAEVDRHTAEARAIFVRLDRLPIGIAVAAKLIRRDPRYTIAGMAKNPPADVFDLLAKAIAALSPAAQTLLAAMAACAPEGFRLSLAAQIVDLNEQSSLDALYEIYSRSLAEELDRDTHRYRLHALVREAAKATPTHRARHAEALRDQFEDWQANWRQCEQDLADWQTAFSWSISQSGDEAWTIAKYLAYSGWALTRRLGRLLEAYDAMTRFRSAAEHRKDYYVLQACYANQGLILQDWGQLTDAMVLHKKQEVLGLQLGNKEGLSTSYGNQALVLMAWGQLPQAMTLLKQQEAICIELGDKEGLQRSYGHQALILQDWGQLTHAMVLHKKQEELCLQLGNKASLQISYGNQALIFKDLERFDLAMGLHKKEEAICIELNDKAGLQTSYGNQAVILGAWGRFEEAMLLHKKEEAICIELGNKRALGRSYGNQSFLVRNLGQLDQAMDLLKQAEAIFVEFTDQNGLAYCYFSWGVLARAMGDTEAEKAKLEQALALFKQLGMPRQIEWVQEEIDQTNANHPPTP